MKDDSIINLQNYLVISQNCFSNESISIFLKKNIIFYLFIPQDFLYLKIIFSRVSFQKNIFIQKIEGNLKYFILLMFRFIAFQICFTSKLLSQWKIFSATTLEKTLRNISAPKIFRHSSSSNLYHRSVCHFFPPFSCSLFDEKKSDARRRYKTATNGIKSRFLKDLPCLTSAATTFTTIFIVFLPRHYRVSSRLCSPTIKKVHSKKSVHPGPSLKASPSPEMTRKREWNTRTLARLFFLHTSKLSFVSFFFHSLKKRRKKRKRERSETFIWCLRRRIYRAT